MLCLISFRNREKRKGPIAEFNLFLIDKWKEEFNFNCYVYGYVCWMAESMQFLVFDLTNGDYSFLASPSIPSGNACFLFVLSCLTFWSVRCQWTEVY